MSLVVRGETVDPAELLVSVSAAVDANGIEILRAGNVVRFTADEPRDLFVLAAPLAAWWQRHGPTTAGDVALRFVGPNGVTELTYSRPDLVVEQVRHTIEVDSGQPDGPEAPGPMHRLTAALLRRVRTGFTASELFIRDEGDLLCVALAGGSSTTGPAACSSRRSIPNMPTMTPMMTMATAWSTRTTYRSSGRWSRSGWSGGPSVCI